MSTFQKVGGLAAWAQALCYIIGFTIFVLFLEFPNGVDPVQSVVFLIDNKTLLLSAMSLIYIFASLILVVLVLALHDKLKTATPALMQVATAMGLIWAGVVIASGMIFIVGAESVVKLYAVDPERAATIWLTIGIVQEGLGGGIELVGGVWIFIISWAALRSGNFSKLLNGLGLFIGIAGILTIIPSLGVFVEVFGLCQIVWFIWLGSIMLITKKAR